MQAKRFNKYSVSNWLQLERSACSRRGYWLSRKLKYLNVEGDRCCMRTGGDHKKHTCGRMVDVGVLLSVHLIEGTAVAPGLWLRTRRVKPPCCSWDSFRCCCCCFFFFYSISHFQEIHRAHRSAGAQRPVRKSKNNPSRDLLRLETSIKTFLTWESDWHEGDLMEVARWQRHFLPTFSLDWHRGAFKRLDFLQ